MSHHICPNCGLRFEMVWDATLHKMQRALFGEPKVPPIAKASPDPARPIGPSRVAWEYHLNAIDLQHAADELAKNSMPRSPYRDFWTGKQPDDPVAKPRDEEWAVR